MKSIEEVYAYKSTLNEGDDFVKDMMKPLNPNELYVSTGELNKILKNKILVLSTSQNPNINNIESYVFFDASIDSIDDSDLVGNVGIEKKQKNIVSIISRHQKKFPILVTAQNTKNAASYIASIFQNLRM